MLEIEDVSELSSRPESVGSSMVLGVVIELEHWASIMGEDGVEDIMLDFAGVALTGAGVASSSLRNVLVNDERR